MNISEEFSGRLREVMNERRMTMADLARLLHTQPSTLTRWFRGSKPQRNNLNELAKTLRVRSEWLAEGRGPREPAAGELDEPTTDSTDLVLRDKLKGTSSAQDESIIQAILSVLPSDQLASAMSKISGEGRLSTHQTMALVAIAQELHSRTPIPTESRS